VPAHAADEQPTLVVRAASASDWMAGAVEVAAAVVPKEQARQQINKAITDYLGPKGLSGLDKSRSMGLYAWPQADLAASPVVVLLPITDEEAFLDLLARAKVKVEKGDDGVHTLTVPQVPFAVYLRFANRYAYIAFPDKSAVAKEKLLEPRLVVRAGPGMFVARVHIDRLPDDLKRKALALVERWQADTEKEQKPGESVAEVALRKALARKGAEDVKTALEGAREAVLQFDRDLTAELGLTAKPGSKLEAEIAALGRSRSRFAGLLKGDVIGSMLVSYTVPKDLRTALISTIEHALREELKNDNDARAVAESLFQALRPTLEAGELDAGFVMRGTKGEHVTAIGGIGLKDGVAVERALREALKKLPESYRSKIHLDVETAEAVKVHRIDGDIFDEDSASKRKRRERILGDNPVFLAVTRDRLVVALGEQGLAALKEALTAPVQASPAFHYEFAIGRIMALVSDDARQPATLKAMGKLGFTVRGGDALSVRYEGLLSPMLLWFTVRSVERRDAEREAAERTRETAEKAKKPDKPPV
jgi:hypothetical protein